jgi:hypothetical protein
MTKIDSRPQIDSVPKTGDKEKLLPEATKSFAASVAMQIALEHT